MSKNNKINQKTSLPKVGIVTGNKNKFALTLNCLKSLLELSYPNFEIIVVNENSRDGTAEKLKEMFPEIILIQAEKDIGYCRASNLGIQKALEGGAEYIFLVSNDTKDFSKNYLEEVIKIFERDKKIGLVGSRVMDFDGNDSWYGQNEKKLGVIRNTPDCGFAVRADLLKEIGLLDEKFFVYFEDLDFILRLRKAGYKTAFVPSVKFAHLGGATISRVGFVFHYYRVRNIFLFLKKHGKEIPFKVKTKEAIKQLGMHLKIIILCFLRGDFPNFFKVSFFVFRGFIAGLIILIFKK